MRSRELARSLCKNKVIRYIRRYRARAEKRRGEEMSREQERIMCRKGTCLSFEALVIFLHIAQESGRKKSS